MGSWGAQACPPPCGERALGEIWRGSELRAQHFPLSVFLLEEFFFPQVLMTLPFLGRGGRRRWLSLPPLQMPDKVLHSTREPELQSFLKMRWRLLPSPAPVPSSFPSPVSGPQSWPRRPSQAGRRPQAHSSSRCHAAEIKDTSSGWAPAKRFKSKSGREGPGPQLCATCKGCSETLCLEPLGWESDIGQWSSGWVPVPCTHTPRGP